MHVQPKTALTIRTTETSAQCSMTLPIPSMKQTQSCVIKWEIYYCCMILNFINHIWAGIKSTSFRSVSFLPWKQSVKQMHVHQMQGAAFINLVYCAANKERGVEYIKVMLVAYVFQHQTFWQHSFSRDNIDNDLCCSRKIITLTRLYTAGITVILL